MTAIPIRLFNSMTRSIEAFVPIEPDHARIYSCGPTVYHYAHLGNLRAYVFTDTLRRTLEYKGLETTHVINITDVGHLTSDADVGDDKMEAAAAREQKTIWDIAAHYTAAFKADVAALNIRQPTRWSIATDHIEDMVNFAEKIAPEHCYELPTGLYFDSSSVANYGSLARALTDEGEGRIAGVSGKRHASDFAIWRKSAVGEQRQMEWDSPWGKGAPGWHLECSVMSIKYLGPQFDIHTGGIDHREIHHPNEIAQNQAYTGTAATGANWWMHNNFLITRTGQSAAKMSKSEGPIATLQALVDRGIHPLAYRLMCLSAHYRSELEFSGENLMAALTRLKRLVMVVVPLRGNEDEVILSPAATLLLDRFDEAISDDLALPRALPLIEEAATTKAFRPAVRLHLVERMDAVLGLRLDSIDRLDLRLRPVDAALTDDQVEALLAARKEARAAKDFVESDRIRDALVAAGIEVMDGDALGWDWKLDLT
ncbi:cysteine--tRNA ligase [Sphingomonas sp.]|uniref:cysteine--tRNA ligase n=1 Tax=Sphingomonas sp. TaxID=28214 RepID=UPI0025CFA27C|nr:cysteine--tRNA ligase [Sphingomonas sp.]